MIAKTRHITELCELICGLSLEQWFPTFLRLGSTYKSKKNIGSTLIAYTNFWEHLIASSWEQFEGNSTWVFLGAPDESFGSTFGPGSTGWETLV